MRKQSIHPGSRFIGDDNPVAAYMKDIRLSAKLSSDEEKALARRIQKGDRKAMRALIEANLKFVVAVCRNYENQGLPMADLINEGNLGLIKAASRFDENQDCRFISYAVWWIRQSIMNALAEQSRPVRLSSATTSAINTVNVAMRKLSQRLGREPSLEEVELETGFRVDRIKACLQLNLSALALDTLPDGTGAGLHATLADESEWGTEARLEKFHSQRALEQVMGALSRREREVIQVYFGLQTENTLNLASLARKMGVTKERVRQIKARALAKLKALLEMMAKYPFRRRDHGGTFQIE